MGAEGSAEGVGEAVVAGWVGTRGKAQAGAEGRGQLRVGET